MRPDERPAPLAAYLTLALVLASVVGAGTEVLHRRAARHDREERALALARLLAATLEADLPPGVAATVLDAGGRNRYGIATSPRYLRHPDPARVGREADKTDHDLLALVRSGWERGRGGAGDGAGSPRTAGGGAGGRRSRLRPGEVVRWEGATLLGVAPVARGDGGDFGGAALVRLSPSEAGSAFAWPLAAAAVGLGLLSTLVVLRVAPRPLAIAWAPRVGIAVAGAGVAAAGPPLAAALAAGVGMLVASPVARLLAAVRARPVAYLYVLPAMLGMAILVFLPFAFGLGLGFFDVDPATWEWTFVGLSHFVEILTPSATGDGNFYRTLLVTVLWTVSNVVLHVGIGLALALILKDTALGRMTGVYRVLLVLPWAIPNYITALIWKGMFNKDFGAVNQVLALLGIEPVNWLQSTFLLAFLANLVTNTWLGFPFMMVVALGALQSIPKELYEAAEVDGASRWQRFTRVTLPLLKPALFPAIILGSIWTFNMFNVIYLVSGGAPNNETNILITEAYRAFRVLGRYGYAAAYSTLIFLILWLYSTLTNRVSRATEGAFE